MRSPRAFRRGSPWAGSWTTTASGGILNPRANTSVLLPGPVAVIDIGSNSIRLLIYEAAVRSPTPLFNEKVLSGLGRKISTTGRLGDKAMERALVALRRFRAVADQ